MKKLFYRLSSAKLFSLLAGVVLGCLFAQPALAQDFFFGWEPFPPSSWGGGWDASLSCKALDGSTTLTRSLLPGKDSVVQDGTVSCTFTDPANNNFEETAICSLDIQFNNLSESCVNNNGSSTLTVTGQCPFKSDYTIVGASLTGTINCEGGGLNAYGNPTGNDPVFCGYAGNDPDGNSSGKCVWTLGYGAKVGSYIVPLTQAQCEQAFPADPNSVPPLGEKEVFKFAQTYAGPACTGEFAGLGVQRERFCHSDTWNPYKKAFCDLDRPLTRGTSSVQGFLTADTEYTPNTINRKCPNNGVITLRVSANGSDPDTNDVAVEEINQETITVNGRPIIPGSCNLTSKGTVLQCKVHRCEGDVSIVENTDTLTMEALMNDGTPVVGDVETKKVVH